jgi:hypothetical protein
VSRQRLSAAEILRAYLDTLSRKTRARVDLALRLKEAADAEEALAKEKKPPEGPGARK